MKLRHIKNIFQKYLMLGALASFLVFFNSCDKAVDFKLNGTSTVGNGMTTLSIEEYTLVGNYNGQLRICAESLTLTSVSGQTEKVAFKTLQELIVPTSGV